MKVGFPLIAKIKINLIAQLNNHKYRTDSET